MKNLFVGFITALVIASPIGLAEDTDVIPTSPEFPAPAAPQDPGTPPAGVEAAKPTAQEAKKKREPARRKHKRKKHRRHHRRHQ